MPRKILQSQRTKFWRLYREGHTAREASRRAGFSESYGKGLLREGKGDNSTPKNRPARFEETDIATRPKHPHELSPVAADCLEDFARFRARYLGSITVPWQVEAAQLVIAHLDSDDDSYGVINAAQGAGKTRLFTHDIPAWLTCRDRTIRGCLGSGTKPISARMTGNLRATFARKSPVVAAERWKARGMAMDAEATLAEDYGRFRPIVAGIQWTREEFTVEGLWEDLDDNPELAEYKGEGQDKEATWAAFSYEAQVMSLRFDFMNWDDLHTHRQLRNPDLMQDLFNWWDVEAESRLDPGGLCLVTMQRLGANDISKYLLSKIDPAFEIDADMPDPDAPRQYFHVVYKAHYEDRCDDRHDRDAPAYPEGCMLDPKRVTWQKMRAKKLAGTYEVVYQQRDADPTHSLVRQVWVDGGVDIDGADRPGCWDPDRATGDLPQLAAGRVRYITVDPSPTKYWFVLDWLYAHVEDTEPLAGRRILIDALRDRMGANELLDWSNDQQTWTGLLEEWVLRSKRQGFPVTHVIMEQNAAQRWAMQYEHFRRWQSTRGITVIPHNTDRNKADPALGIEATLPNVYKYGRVRLPGRGVNKRHVDQLVAEVVHWPDWPTDDGVLSQWFGEYTLPHIHVADTPTGSIYDDIPSWAGAERPDLVTVRVAQLAAR